MLLDLFDVLNGRRHVGKIAVGVAGLFVILEDFVGDVSAHLRVHSHLG